ncbi:MAG TPA: hypothetical protein VL135_14605 [Terracidiphilus sp.]|jgi:hypothetical protein|nr:hypothetical protein [Terracidiphilus sp.]
MSEKCTHTLESGSTCKSPAVRGTSLCFHHTPHETLKRRRPCEYEPFELPPLKNKNSVMVAISQVLSRLAMRRIKRSEAVTLIYGLNIVARLMTELDQTSDEEPIESYEMQSAQSDDSENNYASLQQTVDEIAEGLGVEMPTVEEMMNLRASMPNGTAEQAVNHWISTGRIRPRQQAVSLHARS